MISSRTNDYPRESVEFQEVVVLLDGEPAPAFDVAITARGVRPTTWQTSVLVAGKRGVLVQGLARGTYAVWARVTSTPEVVVILAGFITVS